jgi:RNA-directed DNA polymerase
MQEGGCVRKAAAEEQPAAVPQAAKQAGEIRARWAWVEPSIWTERMLTALEQGVKGGKWFSLIDKVCARRTLEKAFERVKANKGAAGVDRQTVKMFDRRLDENLDRLESQLREGEYQPQAVRRVWIPKPGGKEKRPLGIPTVRDRVVQTALRMVVEPIFERDFAQHSYGFRPGRGCKDALRRVDALLHQGCTWVVDADLKSYFDTIPHEPLLERIKAKISDGRVIAMIEAYMNQQVMDGMESWTPGGGTPQGAIISPLLSNIYLDPLDHQMEQAGVEMVRYADDFVILCRSRQEAEAALERVKQWTGEAGLALHPDKTRIVDATQKGGFDFLGYHFERGMRWPRAKSIQKLRESIRPKTRRTNGHGLQRTIADINPMLRGWFEYFKHSHITTFPTLDGWVRMRLRSILRKRSKRKGKGRGSDHQRWPNAFFAAQGLFSMTAAHGAACRPARR